MGSWRRKGLSLMMIMMTKKRRGEKKKEEEEELRSPKSLTSSKSPPPESKSKLPRASPPLRRRSLPLRFHHPRRRKGRGRIESGRPVRPGRAADVPEQVERQERSLLGVADLAAAAAAPPDLLLPLQRAQGVSQGQAEPVLPDVPFQGRESRAALAAGRGRGSGGGRRGGRGRARRRSGRRR